MPKVTIFTTNTCGYCSMVKKFMNKKGIQYSEINLDEHPERQKEAYRLSGVLSVPVTLIEKNNNKKIVIGYSLPKLHAALA